MTAIRTREYGQPTTRDWERAVDGLTDAVAWTRTDAYPRWEEEYAYLEEGERGGTVIRSSARAVREDLPYADPFYLSSDVLTLINVAVASLPFIKVEESDLITPTGFVWLPGPPIPDLLDGQLVAFGWTMASRPDGTRFAIVAGFTGAGGRVGLYYVSPLSLGESPPANAPFLRLVATFWNLSRQRILVQDTREVSRAVRRRSRKHEINTVVVIDLRRHLYPESRGTRKVNWSHSWLVHGFWRNQWYPSEGRHRLIWVADYLKVTDKPFVAKRRVFEVTR